MKFQKSKNNLWMNKEFYLFAIISDLRAMFTILTFCRQINQLFFENSRRQVSTDAGEILRRRACNQKKLIARAVSRVALRTGGMIGLVHDYCVRHQQSK
jgi:hypothetical protein